MRKNIVLVLLLSLPMALFCQHHGLTHNVEINAGYAQNGKNKGSSLNAKYAVGAFNHLDFVSSISHSHGLDTKTHVHVWDQYSCDAIELGIRGYLDFLKICSLKVEARGGALWLQKMDYISDLGLDYDYPSTFYVYRFCASGQAEFDVRLTPVFSMGVYAGKTWMIDDLCPFVLDRIGLSLCFQFQ